MDAELVKRLKAWFYLRLAPEDWTQFGSSAAFVLQTFDADPDQEKALLQFTEVVVRLELQRLKNPSRAFSLVRKRWLELKRIGLSREQLIKVLGIARLVADGYLELVRDAKGEPVYRETEKGRQLREQVSPPPPQEQ
jgi:hypothetical protein